MYTRNLDVVIFNKKEINCHLVDLILSENERLKLKKTEIK